LGAARLRAKLSIGAKALAGAGKKTQNFKLFLRFEPFRLKFNLK